MYRRIRKLLEDLRDRRKMMLAYRDVFSTETGELVLLHMARMGNLYESSFVIGDPHRTAFEEGKRFMILNILRYAGKSEKMIEMMETLEKHENESTTS